MTELRDTLEAVARRAPTRPETFRDDLWRRIEIHERGRSRRRRRAGAFAVAAAVAATGATSVLALTGARATIADETFVCSAHGLGGVQVAPAVSSHFSSLELYIGTQWAISDDKPGHAGSIYSEAGSCKRSRRTVRLSSAGLRHPNVLTGSGSASTDDRFSCSVPSDLVRLHVSFSRGGMPTSAMLAIRDSRSGKPLVFVSWKPPQMTEYLASSCQRG